MKLNEHLRRYMQFGRLEGHADAHHGELPGMSPRSIIPGSFPENRIGDACKRGYEEAYFEAYLTRSTGKTIADIWKEREQ